MGKRSVKENKNIYHISREDAGLSREAAAELIGYMSDDRIEKIENERVAPHPEEVMDMARVYKNASLTNYYCSHECPIGQKYIPSLEPKELSQIVLELLASLNVLEKEKNRLIDITVDGKIQPEERKDFVRIEDQLQRISLASRSLQMWIEQQALDDED